MSPDWEPYAYTCQHNVFASMFPTKTVTLWTVVNRNEYDLAGDQLRVAHRDGRKYYDAWNGKELKPRVQAGHATLAFPLESRGFGAVLAVERGASVKPLTAFLRERRALTRTPLQSLSAQWRCLSQRITPIKATRPAARAPEGMVTIPAGEFEFRVTGIEIEGDAEAFRRLPVASAGDEHHSQIVVSLIRGSVTALRGLP